MVILGLLCVAGCSKNKEGDNFVSVSGDDKAMNDAIAKAKATSGEFVTAFHAKKDGTKDFFIKKPYKTLLSGVEHMWIEVLAEKDGNFSGVVANEAEETHEVKMGQRVNVKIDEISDWKYQDGKKLIGGYTIRYFVEKMSPKEREAFLKEAGFEL
jgi:uncharacterized protein YegJ (DUF2314 family)